MEAALIIAFREGLEAFLVLGIILAFLEKTHLEQHKKVAWAGFWIGVISSVVLAVIFTVVVDGFESEELQYDIGLGVLLLAIVLLTYMVFWMQHNAILANMQRRIELSTNQKLATFLIVFTAIFREGLETVVFTLALAMDGESTPQEIWTGLSIGLLASALIIWLMMKGTKQIPLKQFFKFSSYFILLIVAGLVSLFIKGMQAAEYLPYYKLPLYDMSSVLSNDSWLGKFLGILIGYDAMPSLLQVIGWVGYLLLIFTVMRIRKK
jgi:high-affinity iron transporter